MKKFFVILLAALTLSLSACAMNTGRVQYIGAENAKKYAAQAAGYEYSKLSFTDTDLESHGNMDYYQVEFVADVKSYEYDIDAITGRVIDSRQLESAPAIAASPVVSEEPVTVSAQPKATVPAADTIGHDAAVETALKHAGLKAEEVTVVKNRLDREDGRQCYEVEFYTADFVEYDYDIDAYSGEVLKFDYDAETYTAPAQDGKGISADEAKAIALAQVPGATLDDIRQFETDYDDGRLEYEGKIVYDGMEYEFEIDGYSGAIRNWEAEKRFNILG